MLDPAYMGWVERLTDAWEAARTSDAASWARTNLLDPATPYAGRAARFACERLQSLRSELAHELACALVQQIPGATEREAHALALVDAMLAAFVAAAVLALLGKQKRAIPPRRARRALPRARNMRSSLAAVFNWLCGGAVPPAPTPQLLVPETPRAVLAAYAREVPNRVPPIPEFTTAERERLDSLGWHEERIGQWVGRVGLVQGLLARARFTWQPLGRWELEIDEAPGWLRADHDCCFQVLPHKHGWWRVGHHARIGLNGVALYSLIERFDVFVQLQAEKASLRTPRRRAR